MDRRIPKVVRRRKNKNLHGLKATDINSDMLTEILKCNQWWNAYERVNTVEISPPDHITVATLTLARADA